MLQWASLLASIPIVGISSAVEVLYANTEYTRCNPASLYSCFATPTLPINSESLDVRIHLEIQYNVDYSISICGTTNLFDEAALVITIYNIDDRPSVTNKAIVRNGRIDFGNILKNGADYPTGTYVAKVTLSSPYLQDNEFIKNAGQEYENLTGELVSRKGAGPTLSYTQEFTI